MKHRLIILATIVLFVSQLHGQDPKEIKILFKEAESYLLYEVYDLALPIYLEMIDKGWDNANINFNVGMCYLKSQGQTLQSIPYFEKAVQDVTANPKEGNYKEEKAPEEAWFWLGKAYRIVGRLDEAINAYKQYKNLLPASDIYYQEFLELQVKNCEIARRMMSNPIYFNKTEMTINQELDNYNPAVSGDGKSMIFTANQKEKDDLGEFYLKVVYSSTFDGYVWSKPKDISEEIGSDGYYISCYLSYDGNLLLLFRDDYGNGNIYFSEKDGRSWGEIQKFPKQISSKDNEWHASISKDGNILYFSSDRAGGIGGTDIYMSVKDTKGRWGDPVNLGEVINSQFLEDYPFITDDGNTLYFASEAHSSMGGFDIFKTTKDAGGNWSEPQNLGYPINTPADDKFYLPMGDGSEAYMAKFPDNGGYKRIYHIEYPEIEKVIAVTTDPVTIDENLSTDDYNSSETTTETIDVNPVETETETEYVSDPIVTQPELKTITVPSEYELKGSLTLQDNKDIDPSFYIHVSKLDGEVVAALSPNINTGEFRTMVKHGTYNVKAFGEGYEPAEKTIFIGENEQNPEVLTFLQMVPKEVSSGEYYSIKSILFDYNSTILDKESQIEIEKLAVLMERNPSLYIEVIGNSDALGTEEYNQKLSVKRARGVVEYITSKGVDNSRFVAKGMGESNSIAINENPDGSDNPEGRRLNRRVDIKIIKSNSDKVVTENIFVPDELKYKENLMYTILLSESQEPLKPAAFNLSGGSINNVWMFQTPSGYLYTVGKFSHQSDALELMNAVVDAGFPEAQVISSFEYNELVQKSSNFYKSKMNETDRKVYTIQLFALKKPLEEAKLKSLPDIEVIKGADGYYRYIYGEYIGKTSARQALSDLISKGHYDAFVVDMNKFRAN
ncbi:MAG: PD40 domain-containing protein [Salinivirgaceae bacterium]|nr:PD40 domain-containing protein [Salinivirgaceae bacterium]